MFDEIPPHLMRLELLSANHAALIHAGLDPMRIENCERAERENWTGWQIAKASKKALLQAVVLKKIRPVSASQWWGPVSDNERDEVEIAVDDITVNHLNRLSDATFYRDDVLAFFGYQTKPEQATTGPSQSQAGYLVNGPTYAKLMQAIEEFPLKYPDYKTNAPKLNDDVRPWMQKPPLKCSVREAQVFSLIIFETLGLPIKT